MGDMSIHTVVPLVYSRTEYMYLGISTKYVIKHLPDSPDASSHIAKCLDIAVENDDWLGMLVPPARTSMHPRLVLP